MSLDRNVKRVLFFATLFVVLLAGQVLADPVVVRHEEGLVHGFLNLSTLDGHVLASGDLLQSVEGDYVTTRLVFHFRDGSLHDETVIFSQRGKFRLRSYHLTQRGPVFSTPMEVTLNEDSGGMSVRYGEQGKEKTATEKFVFPSDLANGLVPVLLKNFPRDAKSMTLSMAVETPMPRMVKLVVKPEGQDSFSIGNSKLAAIRYRIKIEVGGLAGLLAPLVGKQPPDIQVWILGGEDPAFVRMEGPLFNGGPIWRIELASPVWH